MTTSDTEMAEIRDALRRMLARGHDFARYGAACGQCGMAERYHVTVTK